MFHRSTSANGVVYYTSSLLEEHGVPHAFTTRLGGVSPAPFDSLNLGQTTDDFSNLEENYRRIQKAISCTERARCWVHQIHGSEVLDAGAAAFQIGQKADAIFTADSSKILSIKVADCVPILIASEDGKMVAAVHAGWRGVVAGVLPNTFRHLSRGTFTAAIGPCISMNSFEVGPEVVAEFKRIFGSRAPMRIGDNGKGWIDLAQACRLQLLEAGVADDRIDLANLCTYENADEFFSHRRDSGVTGRMAALIAPVR